MAAPAPPDPAAVRAGHRELLRTLRELQDGPDAAAGPQPEALRATVAFLRQSLLPFARSEERAFRPDSAEWTAVTLEHAFLEAETDRLALEVASLSRARGVSPGAEEEAARRVRRTLIRIEALLELHALRDEEPSPAERDPRPGCRAPAARRPGTGR